MEREMQNSVQGWGYWTLERNSGSKRSVYCGVHRFDRNKEDKGLWLDTGEMV